MYNKIESFEITSSNDFPKHKNENKEEKWIGLFMYSHHYDLKEVLTIKHLVSKELSQLKTAQGVKSKFFFLVCIRLVCCL